jgi:hypothetical protein
MACSTFSTELDQNAPHSTKRVNTADLQRSRTLWFSTRLIPPNDHKPRLSCYPPGERFLQAVAPTDESCRFLLDLSLAMSPTYEHNARSQPRSPLIYPKIGPIILLTNSPHRSWVLGFSIPMTCIKGEYFFARALACSPLTTNRGSHIQTKSTG